ncbi:MAG TPA: RNA ligase family protein, partial [Rhodothermales bacterium]|nr:RNA ligase family protein [Rhodothermales bacterium]
LDLLEAPGNILWRFARATGLEEKMRAHSRNLVLQGEIVGEGVQKNPYRLTGQTVRFFTAFDPDTYSRLPLDDLRALCAAFGLETVPVLTDALPLPPTVDAVLALADGPSTLNPAVKREGIVMRSHDSTVSFKAISNAFLLAEE